MDMQVFSSTSLEQCHGYVGILFKRALETALNMQVFDEFQSLMRKKAGLSAGEVRGDALVFRSIAASAPRCTSLIAAVSAAIKEHLR